MDFGSIDTELVAKLLLLLLIGLGPKIAARRRDGPPHRPKPTPMATLRSRPALRDKDAVLYLVAKGGDPAPALLAVLRSSPSKR
jgi:hypothetical protein